MYLLGTAGQSGLTNDVNTSRKRAGTYADYRVQRLNRTGRGGSCPRKRMKVAQVLKALYPWKFRCKLLTSLR